MVNHAPKKIILGNHFTFSGFIVENFNLGRGASFFFLIEDLKHEIKGLNQVQNIISLRSNLNEKLSTTKENNA